jgi:hypothetical protein
MKNNNTRKIDESLYKEILNNIYALEGWDRSLLTEKEVKAYEHESSAPVGNEPER